MSDWFLVFSLLTHALCCAGQALWSGELGVEQVHFTAFVELLDAVRLGKLVLASTLPTSAAAAPSAKK
jgi:hypothetical protein